MPDSIVTIKLTVTETNLVLKKLRSSAELSEQVSKLPPTQAPMKEGETFGPKERQEQRQEAVQLRKIIEKIEN
jgi:hypothetical protein